MAGTSTADCRRCGHGFVPPIAAPYEEYACPLPGAAEHKVCIRTAASLRLQGLAGRRPSNLSVAMCVSDSIKGGWIVGREGHPFEGFHKFLGLTSCGPPVLLSSKLNRLLSLSRRGGKKEPDSFS